MTGPRCDPFLRRRAGRLPFETIGIVNVRRFRVLGTDRPSHPLFVPPDLVHPVVVAAGERHRHLVEVRVKQQRAERVLPACRRAVDPDTCDVVPGVSRRHSLVPEDPVGKPASLMFFHATSWKAFDRLLVPMPSICTTMKPSSAWACIWLKAANDFGTNELVGPA